jgi:tetratricopeptide (TPR) repeat protein
VRADPGSGPKLCRARAIIGRQKILLGRAEETEADVEEALRLSPRDPWVFAWTWFAGVAKSFLDRPEEALVWLRRSVEFNRNFPMIHFYLAGALAQLGRLEEAKTAVKAGLALNPRLTLAQISAWAESGNPICLAQRDRLLERLRSAGAPEE